MCWIDRQIIALTRVLDNEGLILILEEWKIENDSTSTTVATYNTAYGINSTSDF